MGKALLEAHHLSVNYTEVPVLFDISFEIPLESEGKIIGIVGPNGAGKSTLLKAALGLVKGSGRIEFFGQPVGKVLSHLAYVPQRDTIDWDFPLSVFDVVLMGRYGRLGPLKRAKEADREAAYLMLEQVGLAALASRQISELSGGQKQRLFLARAMMQDAKVYLLDEPFAGVDVASEKMIFDLLVLLKKQGKNIFIVHHDLTSIESYFDWLLLLNIRLVALGPLEEVFHAENLAKTFGKHQRIFEEVTRRSVRKAIGREEKHLSE